jgi:membrane protein implicated in regulation of membrane protease activity
VTVGFVYLILFLGGFTVALVTGLLRRAFQPLAHAAPPAAPVHQHWQLASTPFWDFAAAFLTVFGLTAFTLHGVTALALGPEVALAAAAGLIGALALRSRIGHRSITRDHALDAESSTASVVRDIPPSGFGQIELEVEGNRVTMAARSESLETIAAGTAVEVIDRSESVVTVRPVSAARH